MCNAAAISVQRETFVNLSRNQTGEQLPQVVVDLIVNITLTCCTNQASNFSQSQFCAPMKDLGGLLGNSAILTQLASASTSNQVPKASSCRKAGAAMSALLQILQLQRQMNTSTLPPQFAQAAFAMVSTCCPFLQRSLPLCNLAVLALGRLQQSVLSAEVMQDLYLRQFECSPYVPQLLRTQKAIEDSLHQTIAGVSLLMRMAEVMQQLERSVKTTNAELAVEGGQFLSLRQLSAGFRFVLCSAMYAPAGRNDSKPCGIYCKSLKEVNRVAGYVAGFYAEHGVAVLSPLDPLAGALTLMAMSCSDTFGDTCLLVNGTETVYISPPEMNTTAITTTVTSSTEDESSLLCQSTTERYFCLDLTCPHPMLKQTNHSRRWDDDVKNLSGEVYGVLRTAFPTLGDIGEDNITQLVLPCGVSCSAELFTKEQSQQSRTVVLVMAWVVIAFTLFAIISFFLNRKKLNKYPTRILFYINLCYLLGNVGPIGQQFTDYETFVCNDDGTLRTREPHSSGLCTFLFSMMYFFLASSLFWWLCLTQAWYLTFRSFGDQKISFYFKHLEIAYHALVWPLALIMLVAMLGARYVDGVPLYGICFTAREEPWFNFMTIPVIIVGILGIPFLVLGALKARKYRRQINSLTRQGSALHSKRRAQNEEGLRLFLIRITFIIFSSFAHLLLQAAVAIYRKINWNTWEKKTRQKTLCQMTACCKNQCDGLGSDPDFAMFVLVLFFIEMQGIIMTLWIFNKQTWEKWRNVPSGMVRRLSSRESVFSIRSANGRTGSVLESSTTDSGITKKHTQMNRKGLSRMTSREFDSKFGVSENEKQAARFSPHSPSADTEETTVTDIVSPLASPGCKSTEGQSNGEMPNETARDSPGKFDQFKKRESRVRFMELGDVQLSPPHSSGVSPTHSPVNRRSLASVAGFLSRNSNSRQNSEVSPASVEKAAHQAGLHFEHYDSSPMLTKTHREKSVSVTSNTSIDSDTSSTSFTPSSILKKPRTSEGSVFTWSPGVATVLEDSSNSALATLDQFQTSTPMVVDTAEEKRRRFSENQVPAILSEQEESVSVSSQRRTNPAEEEKLDLTAAHEPSPTESFDGFDHDGRPILMLVSSV